MACCIFTAYVMSRLIKACEILDLKIIDIQYNEFDEGDNHSDKVSVASTLASSKLELDGMTCAACVSTIEATLASLQGVHGATVSLILSRATIVHDPQIIDIPQIVAAIQNAGYDARAGERPDQQTLDILEQKSRLGDLRTSFSHAMVAAASITFVYNFWLWTSFLSNHEMVGSCIIVLPALWSQIYVARTIHRSAYSSSQPTMDTLISLSILLGLSIAGLRFYDRNFQSVSGYLASGSYLVTVIIGGRYIQSLLERQNATGLAQLFKLQSMVALFRVRTRRLGSELRKVPALSLQPGDELVLDPGSIVPCDCYILSGKCTVDESTMTGESSPKTRETGDFLMSGTCLLSSNVIAAVSSAQEDSALHQLISSISGATGARPQRTVIDSVVTYFVYIIFLLAGFSFVKTFSQKGIPSTFSSRLCVAGEKAMAILASACPCALGLATPSAILSGVSVAWGKGIIFGGGAATIQRLAKLTAMVMDKTGTLTTGKLNVTSVHGSLQDWQCMLISASEMCDAQVHPVARAVFKWALLRLDDGKRFEQNNMQIYNRVSEPGRGVHCVLSLPNGTETYTVHIGTEMFLNDHGIHIPDSSARNTTNGIVVNIAINQAFVSSLILQDTVRPEAADVIECLRDTMSLHPTILTGDSQIEAARISSILQIPVASSRALPRAKKAFIRDLKTKGDQQVAMIGDGINDAPAFSAADVGILLSPGISRSNRACIQVADVILTGSSLCGLVDAILIAQMTERQIRFNRMWALLYNLIAVSLAMGALEQWGVRVDASMAGSLMAGSSASVLGLSLLLRKRLQAVNFAASIHRRADTDKMVSEK